MNGKVILYLIGKILYFLGVVFAVPMFLGFGYQDDGGKIFAACMTASFIMGFLFQKLGTKITEQYNLTNREGILTVVSTWLMAVCFSSVPFIAAGMLGPVDAFFEAMSGLTTTGATVLPDIEIWPRSLLFWRVWMHWIGGLGIIVIFIALLPIVTFQKKSGDRLQYYSVVTVRSDDFHKGDIVSLKTDQHITAGEILALEHEKIVIGNDKTQSVNCVQYQDKRYFTYEELSGVLKDAEVPEGYVLLNGDLNSSEELSVGELVSKDYITGKVSMVLYPFSTFGRSADYLK